MIMSSPTQCKSQHNDTGLSAGPRGSGSMSGSGGMVTIEAGVLRAVIQQKLREVEARVMAVQSRAVQEALDAAEEQAMAACRSAWRASVVQAGLCPARPHEHYPKETKLSKHQPGTLDVQHIFRSVADDVTAACIKKAVPHGDGASMRLPEAPSHQSRQPTHAPARTTATTGSATQRQVLYDFDDDDGPRSLPSRAASRPVGQRLEESSVLRTGPNQPSVVTMAALRGQQAEGALRQARAAAEAAYSSQMMRGSVSPQEPSQIFLDNEWQAAE